MNKLKKVAAYVLSILVVSIPYLFFLSQQPSIRTIEKKKDVKVGYIKTLSNTLIEVHIMVGDVFAPRKVLHDVGFDLVGVSCYFDPLVIADRSVLLTNPLLNSALSQSIARDDTTELKYFISNLFTALEKSRHVVACFLNNPNQSSCEGDQIVPYVWAAYDRSLMSRMHGVKYLAALPLFDPYAVIGKYSPPETRSRLKNNVEAVTRRLCSFALDSLGSTVKSIGLAAIGSTSHKGGDSRYFLEFSDGFLAALKGFQLSRPPVSLDRIYFVAFDKHEGQYRTDALRGLQAISGYLIMERITSGPYAKFIGGLIAICFFLISIITYQQIEHLLHKANRWTLLGTIITLTSVFTTISWGVTIILFSILSPRSFFLALWWYMTFTLLCLLGIFWMSKRLPMRKKFKFLKAKTK